MDNSFLKDTNNNNDIQVNDDEFYATECTMPDFQIKK